MRHRIASYNEESGRYRELRPVFYVPASDRKLVQEAVTAAGAKGPRDMGSVMKAVQPKIAGRAEGKRVSDAVKAALASITG